MDGTIDRICTALAVPSRWAEAETAVGDAMGAGYEDAAVTTSRAGRGQGWVASAE
ncbi:hypothetical protein BI49514_01926 [Brevibacterium iodinum ATCC 49514]|uniref:Uncharacterized protein n=1 Tax=Brevibacterium iodinum ATCC 49514 TaxID=1255616 RepID=A0A2H1JF25_9MICO|nr:hypothetical protein BI49514_01926 [Brevibacterium iodinum ATCC 49514]SUW11243.1 Uncharacterised protein [Brevibacterium iodinum]